MAAKDAAITMLTDQRGSMSRISSEVLIGAEARVRAMDLKQKEELADDLYREQPHVLASFLVQKRLGVSVVKMEFLIELMLICFQAMKDSGITWPLITEADQDLQLARWVGSLRTWELLSEDLRTQELKRYIDAHPEKVLFAYVHTEVARWLQRVAPEESDKYVALVAMNFVNCISFVALPTPEKAK